MLPTALSGSVPEPTVRVVMAIDTFGFVFVVRGRPELFTEHTILAVVPAPVPVGKEGVRRLAEVRTFVYVGRNCATVFRAAATSHVTISSASRR
jgi:formate/nitrite transporter FocA (FNT family)